MFLDPLENEQNLEEVLESIPQLIHANYDIIGHYMAQNFEPLVMGYQQALGQRNMVFLKELEGQISWIIYIFGAVIGKRFVGNNSSEDSETIDANISARVFKCIGLMNDRIAMQPVRYYFVMIVVLTTKGRNQRRICSAFGASCYLLYEEL